MLSKSPYFARIRAHVLQLTAAIPTGRVCTYQSMGEYLDVVPRHVAYILSKLDDSEKMVYPWHRVVCADRHLGAHKRNPDGRSQADLLLEEGVPVSRDRVESAFDRVFIPAERLPSGLPRQVRPPDAPDSKWSRSRQRSRRTP